MKGVASPFPLPPSDPVPTPRPAPPPPPPPDPSHHFNAEEPKGAVWPRVRLFREDLRLRITTAFNPFDDILKGRRAYYSSLLSSSSVPCSLVLSTPFSVSFLICPSRFSCFYGAILFFYLLSLLFLPLCLFQFRASPIPLLYIFFRFYDFVSYCFLFIVLSSIEYSH